MCSWHNGPASELCIFLYGFEHRFAEGIMQDLQVRDFNLLGPLPGKGVSLWDLVVAEASLEFELSFEDGFHQAREWLELPSTKEELERLCQVSRAKHKAHARF